VIVEHVLIYKGTGTLMTGFFIENPIIILNNYYSILQIIPEELDISTGE